MGRSAPTRALVRESRYTSFGDFKFGTLGPLAAQMMSQGAALEQDKTCLAVSP